MSRQYHDPWAKVSDAASGALFKYLTSQPSSAEQALADAQINNYNANARKTRLEADGVQQQLNSLGNVQRTLGDIYADVESPAPSPEFVGPMMGQAPSGDVIQERFTQNLPDLFSDAMRYSSGDPKDLGQVFMAIAGSGGASPEQLTNAQMGAGMDYAKTQHGFDEDSNFTLSPGSVRYDRYGNEVASAPFKETTPGTFNITSPDGTKIEYGGITPAKKIVNDLQGQQVAAAKVRGLLDFTKNLAKKDYTNFGALGLAKGFVQDTSSLLGGISKAMGYNAEGEAVADTQQKILEANLNPELFDGIFDPDLPALHTASNLLVFQAASALAEQSGRSVSDRDVKVFKDIVGDPTSFFSTQEKFLSKLDTVGNILGLNENVADTTLGGNVTGSASGQPAQPGWSDDDERRLQELEQSLGGM